MPYRLQDAEREMQAVSLYVLYLQQAKNAEEDAFKGAQAAGQLLEEEVAQMSAAVRCLEEELLALRNGQARSAQTEARAETETGTGTEAHITAEVGVQTQALPQTQTHVRVQVQTHVQTQAQKQTQTDRQTHAHVHTQQNERQTEQNESQAHASGNETETETKTESGGMYEVTLLRADTGDSEEGEREMGGRGEGGDEERGDFIEQTQALVDDSAGRDVGGEGARSKALDKGAEAEDLKEGETHWEGEVDGEEGEVDGREKREMLEREVDGLRHCLREMEELSAKSAADLLVFQVIHSHILFPHAHLLSIFSSICPHVFARARVLSLSPCLSISPSLVLLFQFTLVHTHGRACARTPPRTHKYMHRSLRWKWNRRTAA